MWTVSQSGILCQVWQSSFIFSLNWPRLRSQSLPEPPGHGGSPVMALKHKGITLNSQIMSNQGESAICFITHQYLLQTWLQVWWLARDRAVKWLAEFFYRNHRLYPPLLMSPGPGLCRVTMVRRYDESCLSQTRRLFWSEQLRRHLERDRANNMLLVTGQYIIIIISHHTQSWGQYG